MNNTFTKEEKKQAAEYLRSHLDTSDLFDIKVNEPILNSTFLKIRPEYNIKYGETNKEVMLSLLEKFGSASDKIAGKRRLSIDARDVNEGFVLRIDDREGFIYLLYTDKNSKTSKLSADKAIAVWDFKTLRKSIKDNYPPILFAEAEKSLDGDSFRFTSFKLRHNMAFYSFLSMIKLGYISYKIKIEDGPKGYDSEQKWVISQRKKDIENIYNMFPVTG